MFTGRRTARRATAPLPIRVRRIHGRPGRILKGAPRAGPLHGAGASTVVIMGVRRDASRPTSTGTSGASSTNASGARLVALKTGRRILERTLVDLLHVVMRLLRILGAVVVLRLCRVLLAWRTRIGTGTRVVVAVRVCAMVA